MIKRLKIEHTFLIISLIFGVLWTFILPPFQSPDETVHLYRAYITSNGNFQCVNNNGSNAGGYLPTSMGEFLNVLKAENIRFHPEKKQNLGTLKNSLEYFPNKEKEFIEFPGSCAYSPVPYIPQSIGILLANLLGMPWLIILYVGRIVNLLAYIAISYWAIKLLPILKRALFLLLLMPMSLHQAGSLSADVLTISICVFYVAYILYLKYKEGVITKKENTFLVVLSALLGLLKITYFPLALLFLLLPKTKYKTTKTYYLYLSIVVISSFIFAGFWMLLTRKINLVFPVDPVEQLKTILNAPFDYFILLIKSFFYNNSLYTQFFGVFGWLDTPLPVVFSYVFYAILLLVIILDSIKDKVEVSAVNIRNGVYLLVLFIGCVFVIESALFLNWPQPSQDFINGVQGRYFIPIIMLFVLSIYFLFPLIRKYSRLVIVIFVSCILLSSSYCLVQRYYYFGPEYNFLETYENKHIVDGIQSDTFFEQSFISDKNNLKGVNIYFSTYQREINTEYVFYLLNDKKEIVRTVPLDVKRINDNQFFPIEFEPIENSKGKQYYFTVKAEGEVKNPMTIQIADKNIYHDGVLMLNNETRDDDLVFRLIY